MSLTNFNLYIFWGHYGEFCDLVTSLSTKVEPLPYSELHSDLSIHEFLHKSSLLSIQIVTPLLPTPTKPPSTFATQCGFSGFNGSDSSPHQVEEGMVARETLEATSISLVVRLFIEIVVVLLGSKIMAMVAIGSNIDQQPQISGHDRSDVSFVTRLVIQHSSVHIMCIMGINPRPPSPLVML
jgi:hypothetical protein